MNEYSIIEIFTLLFATMGPIKVLITFAEKTQGLEKTVKRRIAINAVGVAHQYSSTRTKGRILATRGQQP